MTRNLRIIDWQQARKLTAKINPQLTDLIDKINPDKRFGLYQIKYSYGDEILKDGHLQVPNDKGQLCKLADHPQASTLQKDLNYNFGANPVGLVLNNSAELFIQLEERVIPFSLISSGKIFGLWRLLDPTPSYCPFIRFWGITAGARSLFMLAKISDTISFNRMKKEFCLKSKMPKDLQSHWHIFKEISNCPDVNSQWNTELLFFSQEWFQYLKDPLWKDFYNYLLECAWKSSGFWRNQFTWQLIFSLIQNQQKLKSSAHIADLIQHIFMVSVGALPGFASAINDTAAPIKEIQNVYQDSYNLKLYDPIIMQPEFFSANSSEDRPVYLSLQHPTAMELAPKFSDRENALADLLIIQKNIYEYFDVLLDKRFNINETPLSELPNDVQIDYFHSSPKDNRSILESSLIPLEDFNFNLIHTREKKQFPADSPFFKGCIRIKKTSQSSG